MGDVEGGDSEVTVADARTILRIAVGLDVPDAQTAALADMDLDGEISVSDARLALRAAVGLERVDGNAYFSQLDVLQSGHYYADITVREADGGVDMVLAKTADSVYFDAVLAGTPMTMLSNAEGLYFIDKSTREYAELTDEIKALMSELGGEEFGAETFIGELPDLGETVSVEGAEKTAGVYGGEACDCYVLSEGAGVTRVYMQGPRLLAMRREDADGDLLTELAFNAVLPTVPAECTAVNAAYTPKDFLEFLLENYAEMFEGAL